MKNHDLIVAGAGSAMNIVEAMVRRIFEQEQIARTAELGLGVASAEAIDLVETDEESIACRDRVAATLLEG